MANTITRLLPHRVVNPYDIVNFYSLDSATGAAGSLVKISSGDLDNAPVEFVTRSDAYAFQNTLGNAYSPHNTVPHKVTLVTGVENTKPLGFLLNDVRQTDENGENLQYYKQKREELQCVLSGEAVPIATRGILTFNSKAIAGTGLPTINQVLIPAANGQITGVTDTGQTFTQRLGVVLASGTRASQQDTDAFAGNYIIAKIDL